MFKLSQSESFSWPVKVTLPIDGGQWSTQSFDAVFKRLPQSKIREMLNAEDASDISFCKDVLMGWKGITDDSGGEVPYSEGARDRLLDVPSVAKAIVEEYMIASQGKKGARLKN